ncbi:DUF1648 domain-containing protein [Leifsonia sp. McL0607]|uniref:DUF1648 domain-containing protein n=1 Tax=Leifsonia sp. McL0607 TaxID=3415672 RepID=UPI003CEDDA70
MTAVLVSTLAVATLIAAILLMLPAMSRATLPLGVLVPRSRAADPVVVTAVRRFRIGVVVSYVVALVVAAFVAGLGPAAPPLAATLVLLVGSVVGYLLCRRSIQAANRAGGWLDDVPVRISGTVTPDPAARSRPAFGWFAAAFVVLATAAAVGVALYDSLPATIAVHWNASGQADRFAEKSFFSVFGPILIGVAVLALIVGIAFVVRSVPWRRAGDRPEVGERIAALQAHLTQSLLGWTAFVVAAAISVLSGLGWLHAESSEPSAGIAVVTVGLIVVIFVVIAAYAVRLVSGTRAIRAGVEVPAGSVAATSRDTIDPRDDDRHWKGGLIYVNAGDPALFVPKRFGVGVTLNLGHPGGIAIAVVTLLLIVAALTLPVLLR